jgi:DNA polymerase III delta subunit
LSLLETLRGQGEPAEALLPQAIRAIQRLCLGKALLNERAVDRAQMFERFRLRMRDVQEDFAQGLSRWSWDELGRALDGFVRVDSDMKSGRGSPDADLTRLVRSLTREEATRR